MMIRFIKKIVGAVTPTKKKSTIFYGPDKPTEAKKGDIWFDTKYRHQPKIHLL